MNRFLGPLARRVDTPWKIYPIGFLFGLGFDTATEIALLVLAGTAVAGGLPFYAILSLPILFAAGMSLFDTADGCFMNFAYDWAFAKPVRKVYYNLTITGLSVFVAVFIGAIELLGLLSQNAHLTGSFWSFLAGFNINTAGFVIVGVFVVTWIVALCIWHFGRIEQKWESGPRSARPSRLTRRYRPRQHHQVKSSSQNSVTPRADDGRDVSRPRSSTRRILPEIVLGRSPNSSSPDPLVRRHPLPAEGHDRLRQLRRSLAPGGQQHVGLRHREPNGIR